MSVRQIVRWLAQLQELNPFSEMALLSRLHWYTVEYGLIGTLENPKIYGAGLLSSIGESVSCMQPNVKKLWYNLDTVNYRYDITKTQPQLFVTPNFENLIEVLEAFADTMSFRKGGAEGILKAIECKKACTAVYSSGLQVTGVFTTLGLNDHDELEFIKTSGPSALSFENKQLEKHGKDVHQDGFSSPVGKLKNINKPLEDFSNQELQKINIEIGKNTLIEFESGIILKGEVTNIIRKKEKIILISWQNCTVKTAEDEILFDPSWGVYDMAVGEKVISVFCGAADKDAFEEIAYISKTVTKQSSYSKKTLNLHQKYQQVRAIRNSLISDFDADNLFLELKTNYQDDWLCSLELLEVLHHLKINEQLRIEINNYLESKAFANPELKKLITDGLKLIANPVHQLILE